MSSWLITPISNWNPVTARPSDVLRALGRSSVLKAAFHVDYMHLQGEGLVVVGVLGAPGIILAPVEVKLEDLVFL